jgi:hypothetical protein
MVDIEKEHIVNPGLLLVGHFLYEVKETIRNKDKKFKKVNGSLEVVYTDERVSAYKDIGKFIKVYEESDALGEFIKLSASAQRLMYAIIKETPINVDYFYYAPISLGKIANINEHNVSTYIRELLEKEWLYRSNEKRKYWINPCFFYKGDREELYKKYKITQT